MPRSAWRVGRVDQREIEMPDERGRPRRTSACRGRCRCRRRGSGGPARRARGRTRRREEDRERGGEEGVELLSRVEPPCGARRPRSQRRSSRSIVSISCQSSRERRRFPAMNTAAIATARRPPSRGGRSSRGSGVRQRRRGRAGRGSARSRASRRTRSRAPNAAPARSARTGGSCRSLRGHSSAHPGVLVVAMLLPVADWSRCGWTSIRVTHLTLL